MLEADGYKGEQYMRHGSRLLALGLMLCIVGIVFTAASLSTAGPVPATPTLSSPISVGISPATTTDASCTNLDNWQCVDTRAGLSLCRANNVCVVKVDLNNSTIRPKVVVAPGGGTAWLDSMASGAGALAAINGDYFSGCPDGASPLNCGEGLTFVDGTDYTDYTGSEWQNRRSLGFNDGYDPNIGWPGEQGSYHRYLLGGGPQITFGGEYRWRCWYQGYNTEGDCNCQDNTVVINDELFSCSANNWWNRPQTFVGFSDDGNTLYLAKSEPGYTKTPHEMHDVLWVHGARHTLKMDGGGSSGMYFNDGGYQFAWNGGRAVANAWVIVPDSSPPPTSTPPPDCNPNADQIALFVDLNYGGQCVVKGIGDYANPSAIGLPNDSISSVKVGGNVEAILCEHDDFAGTCEAFTGDDANLGDNSIGEDSVSSVKVQPSVANEVRLYDGVDYSGDYVYVTSPGLYTMVDIFNDRAESVQMPSGWSVRLFKHDDYYGPEVCIQGSDPDLWDDDYDDGAPAANSATWFEVYDQSECPPIGTPPDAPTLSSPSDSSSTCDATPHFDWSSVSEATSYRIQVDNDAGFGSPEVDATMSNSDYTPGSSLSPDAYYWRVQASNSFGSSPWSSVWSFAILPTPSAPSLSSPTNGSSTPDTTPHFDWSSVSGAVSYRIQVDNDAWFNSPEIDTTTSNSNYTPGLPLSPGSYHWHARTSNSCGDSPWSSTWNFTIQGDVGPLVYAGHMVDDDDNDQSSGNNDGVVNCGETIELYVDLYNQGGEAATGVTVAIRTDDPYITWLYNTDSSYPNIPGGGTEANGSDFDFTVDPNSPDGHAIQFDLDINASNAGPWADSFDVSVMCDDDPPTGRITSPANGIIINECPLTIQAEASDSGSGVDLVRFHAYYDDGWRHLGDDSTSPYTWNWDCFSISNQDVWLTIQIWDNAGNEVTDPGGYVYITLERFDFDVFLPCVLRDSYAVLQN